MKSPIRITSPGWSGTTKILVGVVILALLGMLLVKIQSLIAPLILVLVLIYVFRPLITRIHNHAEIPWALSVGLVYLALLLIVGFLGAEVGGALVQQAADLAQLAQNFVEEPTDVLSGLPFLDLLPIPLDVQAALQLGASLVQPMLGSMGGIVRSVAGAAATTVGWLFFILVVSYFILLDLEPDSGWSLARWTPQGYHHDMYQLGERLSGIWQRFLFGQGLLFVLTVIIVTLVLTLIGLPNALALGLLSGLARFVPYVGPTVVWFLIFIVALGQSEIPLGISPLGYAVLVVALQIMIDQVFDNMVAPRLFGQVLGVHPAAVLITAIASVFVIGPVGLLVAAPVLATIIQIGRYTINKLFDLQQGLSPPDYEAVNRDSARSIDQVPSEEARRPVIGQEERSATPAEGA